MTGLIERLQAFRLGEDGRSAAADDVLQRDAARRHDDGLRCHRAVRRLAGDHGAAAACASTPAPTFASARWGMARPQTVTWKWDEAGGLAAFEKAKAVMDEAEAHNSGRLDAMVFPAQIDTVTPELFAAGRQHADETGRPLLDPYRPVGGRGARDDPPPRHDTGPVGGGAGPDEARHHPGALHPARRASADRLAHAKDLDLIAEAGAAVAHCPQPFARYGLAMDHVGRYRARGVKVGLGTDCAPHNLIEEMRLAIVAGRLMSEDIASLDTGGAFEAATIGGASGAGPRRHRHAGARHGGRHRAGRSRASPDAAGARSAALLRLPCRRPRRAHRPGQWRGRAAGRRARASRSRRPPWSGWPRRRRACSRIR